MVEKIDLEFLARQLDRLIAGLADLKDDMAVLKARLGRLEATSNMLAVEIRAMHNRHQRLSKRSDGLEDRDQPEAP